MEIYGRGDSFDLRTPRNQAFIDELKAKLPAGSRRWGGRENPVWICSAAHLDTVQALCQKHYGRKAAVSGSFAIARSATHTIKLEYLGLPKQRPDGTISSFGWVNEGWNAVFNQAVLEGWFNVSLAKPASQSTPWEVLGVPVTATAEAIKTAWRKGVRTWHPDVCQEPGARQQFEAIQAAYETLKDPALLARLEAARYYLGSSSRSTSSGPVTIDWRPPVRCGNLTVEATLAMGVYQISRVIDWRDIADAFGNVMVSSWKKDADHFSVRWVER